MRVIKCDICKMEIYNREQEVVAGEFWRQFSFCQDCGEPILSFLDKHQLLPKLGASALRKKLG